MAGNRRTGARDAVDTAEEPYGSADATRLVEALSAEVERRYAGSDPAGGMAPSPAGAWPAPPTVPPGDPRWALDPRHLVAPRGSFVLARIDGAAVGCGALRPLPAEEPSTGIGELKRIYVDPGARRQGVARVVVTHLVATARVLGYRSLVLETGTEQPEALALYEAMGWHPVTPYGEYRNAPGSRSYGLVLPQAAEVSPSAWPKSLG